MMATIYSTASAATGCHTQQSHREESQRKIDCGIRSLRSRYCNAWLPYVLDGLGISRRDCFSAARFPVKIATAEVMAFSPPHRTGPPVRIAEQNSAISFR